MDLRVGDKVTGQDESNEFEITRFIGNGNFGLVYEIKDVNGESYALKTISTATLDDFGLKTLINEGGLAAKIRHQNVITVHFFHDGKKYPKLPPYMISEYADGGTLEDLLAKRKTKNSYFQEDELRKLFLQLCSGIKAINEKLVHRDIKPDNILISKAILKISDFGLSKIVSETTRNYTFKGINHIMYCAPEAWRGEKNTPLMDMYSMGIVFYNLATLDMPYQIDHPGDIIEAWKNAHLSQLPKDPRFFNPSLPTDIVQTIQKMLSKRPEERYSSWDEAISRLQSKSDVSGTHVRINRLVEKALESHRVAEESRLLAEKEARRIEENTNIISFCFEKDIVTPTEDLIAKFNEHSDIVKLNMHRGSERFGFFIHAGRNTSKGISAKITPLDNHYDLNKAQINIVRAWGFVKAPSGRGFNLLLVATTPEAIYGSWMSLHVRHAGWTTNVDKRPEPFPFELNELRSELQYIDATHVFTYDIKAFDINSVGEIIQELL